MIQIIIISRLEKYFGLQRAKSMKKIQKIMVKHQNQLQSYEN